MSSRKKSILLQNGFLYLYINTTYSRYCWMYTHVTEFRWLDGSNCNVLKNRNWAAHALFAGGNEITSSTTITHYWVCVFFLYHHLLSKCPSESYVEGGGSKCLHSKIERWKYKKKKTGSFRITRKTGGRTYRDVTRFNSDSFICLYNKTTTIDIQSQYVFFFFFWYLADGLTWWYSHNNTHEMLGFFLLLLLMLLTGSLGIDQTPGCQNQFDDTVIANAQV